MKTIILPILALALFYSCQNTEPTIIEDQVASTDVQLIKPIKGIDPEVKLYNISADQADTIFLDNGGTVIFQQNSFVDSDGNIIKGDVDVSWQEFHSLADILASGIPMTYDSIGTNFNLTSGGMFTINAKQNDKEINIAEGKSATVNLVSIQDTPCYNFYELDEEKGSWNYETTKNGQQIEALDEKDRGIILTILNLDVNVDEFENLSKVKDKIVGWKTEDKISSIDRMLFEEHYKKSKLSSTSNKGVYNLEIAVSKDTKRQITVEPYFLKDAKKDARKNRELLQKEINEIEEYQTNLALGKIVRSIQIKGFGTYNWDIVYKRANSKRIVASFNFSGGVNPKLITMALISPDENLVIKYDAFGDSNFSFDPEKRACLVGILPSNELVVVSNDGFDAPRKMKNGTFHTFKFKATGIKIDSASQLMNHIDQLL